MCGIVGFWQPGAAAEDTPRLLTAMECALAHRGPDDSDIWFEAGAGVGFGHRRLAIVELSPLGRQPMHSASGRYTICFNGEVFNFGALCDELRRLGHSFRGHSDTEVMLAAIEQWGLVAAVKRFVGMFAFSLWDAQEQQLQLVRDRLGIKPVYYGLQQGAFLFGSELKGLRAHPAFGAGVDRDALALFLRLGYIPAPHTIHPGIFKQTPGTILSVHRVQGGLEWREQAYWSARSVAEAGMRAPLRLPDDEAIARLDAALRDAVRLRMIADVPLGAFLSGGVDSSTVVALMQAQSARPVRTFAIGFSEADYNEAPFARAVAQHLGTDHTELIVTPAEAMAVIPRLPTMYDEPFADSSQIPTFLVSQMTRGHVTVSLSGDGGDELFGGYGRYPQTLELWQRMRLLPPSARAAAAALLRATPAAVLNRGFGWMAPIFRRYGRFGADAQPADKLHTLAGLLQSRTPLEAYHRSLSFWPQPQTLALQSREPATAFDDPQAWATLPALYPLFMYLDLVTYLPDDILVKVDRASMAVALEARVPLLDHRVVELAWRLPMDQKVRAGERKWILRRVLDRYVPRTLIERPKMGFALPVFGWLRGPLRPWAEALLDERRLAAEGYLEPTLVRAAWKAQMEGRNRGAALWNVLMFQAWLEEQTRAR